MELKEYKSINKSVRKKDSMQLLLGKYDNGRAVGENLLFIAT